jgi:hypothetical protein
MFDSFIRFIGNIYLGIAYVGMVFILVVGGFTLFNFIRVFL